ISPNSYLPKSPMQNYRLHINRLISNEITRGKRVKRRKRGFGEDFNKKQLKLGCCGQFFGKKGIYSTKICKNKRKSIFLPS
ncbi:MAG: hypothetical protein LIO91_00440, partial [Bacteroidales bacterium]|nr:hypothetical protein [Bacteroidales bacterium]